MRTRRVWIAAFNVIIAACGRMLRHAPSSAPPFEQASAHDGRSSCRRNSPSKRYALLALLIPVGCYDNENDRTCNTSDDCHGAGAACIMAPQSRIMFCATDAAACPTGQRWSDDAGDELGGTCVAPVSPAIDAGVGS
jgi:hypothetical protein